MARAKRYLLRMTVLHVSAVVLFVGMLFGVLDLGVPGVALMAFGLCAFVWAVLSAWSDAVRNRSTGQSWFGTRSVAADANRLTSWWYVPEACKVLGRNEERVRRLFSRLAAASVVALVAVPVAAIVLK